MTTAWRIQADAASSTASANFVSSSGTIGLTFARLSHDHDVLMFTFSPEITRINQFAGINEDILYLIFEHFDLQPGSKSAPQTRTDLLSAAKVCKAFSEPALKSLWRVLPSLLPLLLLIPSAKVVNDRFVSYRFP